MDDLVEKCLLNYIKSEGLSKCNFSFNKYEKINKKKLIDYLKLNHKNVNIEDIQLNSSGVFLIKDGEEYYMVDLGELGYKRNEQGVYVENGKETKTK